MRVLVTGGTGTVGEAIVQDLVSAGNEVIVYATSAPDELSEEFFGAQLAIGDILDQARLRVLMHEFRPHITVHAAAVTPGSEREATAPDSVLEVNVVGALRTLAAFAEAGGERFVYLSSVAAYGDSVDSRALLHEVADDGRPRNLYELSKQTAETAVLRVSELRGVNATCLRLGDVFGPGEKFTPSRDTLSAPFQLTCLAASGDTARLPREGRKEWIYTRDVAKAVLLTLETAPPLPPVMNISSGFTWSLIDWCELLRSEWSAFQVEIDTVTPNVTLFSDNPPLCTRNIVDLGFQAQWDLRRAFDDYLQWWKETQTNER